MIQIQNYTISFQINILMNTMIQKKETKEELGFKIKPINLKIIGYDYGKLYIETSDEVYDDYEEE